MKTDWQELVSQPKYKIKTEKDVFIPMRDGVRCAADVYRPDAEGKFPALLALSPYGKEQQELLIPPQPLEHSSLWDGVIEAGDTNFIVPRGYVHVIPDLRGTGDSEGEYIGMYSKQEAEDGYDLVEWIAKQPWCNGNVGMIGYSYFGAIQIYVACEQPPHLKAIFPTGCMTDLYRGMAYHGGVLCMFLYGLIDGRRGTSGYASRKVVSEMMRNLPKEEFDQRRKEALSNPDIQHFPNLFHLLNYPLKNPLFFDILLNPLDGPFYEARAAYKRYDKIKIPVYGVSQWGHHCFTRGQLDLHCGINSPKKLMMHPLGFIDRPWRTDQELAIRWFDHWLKGIDTGIMDEPPIKLFVNGVNKWRSEEEWPLPSTQPTKLYLRPWEALSLEPEAYQDEPDCFVQHPLYVSPNRAMLQYLSPPLPEDLETIGDAAVYLFASIDMDDTNWIVNLFDVSEYGSEVKLSTGYLKASHRALDTSKSTPLQPYHPHTSVEPVVPGEIYEYAIELVPISNVFKAGHRIKLTIESMSSPRDPDMVMHFRPHLCSSKTTLHKIYRDKNHSSHILLPVIPPK
ncbi:CocE/NonD family hydrolase [Chloroflexota bacterium]